MWLVRGTTHKLRPRSFWQVHITKLITWSFCALCMSKITLQTFTFKYELCLTGEQDPDFWKEVATALVYNIHNTKTSLNCYPITMFLGGPLHEPYFRAINNLIQVIIGSNKKMVATYMVGELEVLIWFIRTWILKRVYYYNWCLLNAT